MTREQLDSLILAYENAAPDLTGKVTVGRLNLDLVCKLARLGASVAAPTSEEIEAMAKVVLRNYIGFGRYANDVDYCDAQLMPQMQKAVVAALTALSNQEEQQ